MAFAAIALGISSCDQKKLSPNQNLPTYKFTKLSENSSAEKDKPVNLFTIEVSNEKNEVLHLVLATLKNSLPTGLYTPATTAELADGKFDSEKSYIQIGGSNKAISSKQVVINSVGKNLYSITCVNSIDGKDYMLTTSALEIKLSIPETQVSNYTFPKYDITPNTGLVTVKMYEESVIAEKVVIDLSQWGMEGTYEYMEYKGSGKMLSLDLYSADGKIADGVYQGVENSQMGPGKFAFGYKNAQTQGAVWGGCFTVFDNGQKVETAVTAGTVTVKTSGKKQTITAELELENDTKIKTKCDIILEGGPDTPPVGGDVIIVPQKSVQVNKTEDVITSITIKMWEEGLTYDAANWMAPFSGTGSMISIDFGTDSEELQDGIYEGIDNASLGPGKFAFGYNDPWGMGMIWGGCFTNVVDGAKTEIAITAGTVEVKTIDGEQVIICDVELSDGTKVKTTTKK